MKSTFGKFKDYITHFNENNELIAIQGRAFGNKNPKYITIKIDENRSEPTNIKIISENSSVNKLQDLSIKIKKKSNQN